MSSSGIGVDSLSSAYLLELRGNAIESAGVAATSSATSAHDGGSAPESDSSQLSPFAKLASALLQLQQQDPDAYRRITARIAHNLQSASAGSGRLSQVAADFARASETGELPDLENLAAAVGELPGETSWRGAGADAPIDPLAIIFETLANAGIAVR